MTTSVHPNELRPTGGGQPIVPEEDVHIWWIDLDALRRRRHEFEGVLSVDESEQSRRFRRDTDRRRFIARRAVRKQILATYLGCRTEEVQIAYSAFGQPTVTPGRGRPRLCFGTSHSDGVAVLAVGTEGRIGIDIERLRPIPDARAIARGHCTKYEADLLETLFGTQRDAAFLAIWTAKEAFVKALGEGLSFPLDAVCVHLEDGNPTELVVEPPSTQGDGEWFVSAAALDPQFTGTIVADRPVRHIQWRRWE